MAGPACSIEVLFPEPDKEDQAGIEDGAMSRVSVLVLLLGDGGSVLDPNMCYQLTISVVVIDGLRLLASQN